MAPRRCPTSARRTNRPRHTTGPANRHPIPSADCNREYYQGRLVARRGTDHPLPPPPTGRPFITDTAEPTPQERFNNAIEGLRHLPATGAVTFRGVTSPRGQTPEVLVTQNITATSRDLSVASIGLTSPGIAVVVARTGRDLDPISAVPAAQEVALLPGTVLYIGRFIHAAGHDVELIEQLTPDGSQDEWTAHLTAQAVAELTSTVSTIITNAQGRPCPIDSDYCQRFTTPLV